MTVRKGPHMAKELVLILLGPTCVGKTSASLLLARALATEIISADSMQIYRHMDIGTAKPTAQERAQVRHHMIDIVAPSESFSTGKYIEGIVPIIDDLHRKRMIPLIVGGTGLYIKAMTRGIFRGPAADWALRENLLAMENESGGSLYANLQKLDLAASSRIMPSDIRRIIRALEVCMKTHTGISELQKERTAPLPYEFIKIGLTRERGELYRLIEKRIDAMLSQGLMDEVKSLLLMNPGKTALQAIGYKEIAAHLRGEYPLDEAARLIKKRTKNYAKRQFTWFKAEADIRWLDITGFSTPEEVQRAIAILLKMH
jgi:tRNA dimethylallyltransferase